MEWTSADSAQLRTYDNTTGCKLRAYLRTRIPAIRGETIEAVALSSKERAGAEYMLEIIEELLSPPKIQKDGSDTGFTSM